jgi:hypothetical protein
VPSQGEINSLTLPKVTEITVELVGLDDGADITNAKNIPMTVCMTWLKCEIEWLMLQTHYR